MKLAKLSLAAMVVAGLASSSFAADTLADAFKNGKVKGQLKAWYFDKTVENEADENANVLALGLELNYVTDSLYGFYAGATFQGASQPWIEDDAKARFNNEMHTSGAVLSEAYLGYKIGKTNAKIGRQYIATPLVNGSGSRIFKESFEGVTVVNTDIPQTTLIAGYVNKFQGRTSNVSGDGLGDAPKFKDGAAITGGVKYVTFDGIYTLGLINKSITGLTLTGQYTALNDVNDEGDVDVYYTEANYVLPVAGFKLGFDVNYRGSQTDGALSDTTHLEGDMLAGRVSIKELAGFGASFAASTTDSNDNVILGVGNGPSSYTGTLIRASAETAAFNTDAYLFTATYDFSKLGATGLGVLAQYGKIEQDKKTGTSRTKDTELTSYAAAVTYDVAALKGLSLALQYETQETDKDGASKYDTDELRFLANYKF